MGGTVAKVFAGNQKFEWYRLTFLIGFLLASKVVSILFPHLFAFDFSPPATPLETPDSAIETQSGEENVFVAADAEILDPSVDPVDMGDVTPLFGVINGLMVGFGSSVTSGCTIGHGILGFGLSSPRSIAATIIFFSVHFVVGFFL